MGKAINDWGRTSATTWNRQECCSRGRSSPCCHACRTQAIWPAAAGGVRRLGRWATAPRPPPPVRRTPRPKPFCSLLTSCTDGIPSVMRRKRLRWLGLLCVLLLAGTILHPAVYWHTYGWVRGESFYQGRPTSYWREEIRAVDQGSFLGGIIRVDPKPSWAPEIMRPLWGDVRQGMMDTTLLPAILSLERDPAAVPVLLELAQDDDDWVKLLAGDFLRAIDPDAAHGARVD
jgi:hypothetical protein